MDWNGNNRVKEGNPTGPSGINKLCRRAGVAKRSGQTKWSVANLLTCHRIATNNRHVGCSAFMETSDTIYTVLLYIYQKHTFPAELMVRKHTDLESLPKTRLGIMTLPAVQSRILTELGYSDKLWQWNRYLRVKSETQTHARQKNYEHIHEYEHITQTSMTYYPSRYYFASGRGHQKGWTIVELIGMTIITLANTLADVIAWQLLPTRQTNF